MQLHFSTQPSSNKAPNKKIMCVLTLEGMQPTLRHVPPNLPLPCTTLFKLTCAPLMDTLTAAAAAAAAAAAI
jgi:hypothetical protein